MSLVEAIVCLRKSFEKYAGKDGNSSTMTKAEVSAMLRAEFPCADNKEEHDKFFQMLDEDKSGAIEFGEFACFVATLSTIVGKK